MKYILLLILPALIALGCGHKKVVYESQSATFENEKNGLTATVIWLKNKKESVDVLLRFTSSYSENVILSESSAVLDFAGIKVPLKSGSDDIVLRPSLNYEKILIFPFGANKPKEGVATLTFDPISKETGGTKVAPLKLTLQVTK